MSQSEEDISKNPEHRSENTQIISQNEEKG